MNKHYIRKVFIEKRNQLSQVEYEGLCQKLLYQFRQVDLSVVKCLHLFMPVRKEPDTLLIRNWVKQQYPQIKIVYPKIDFATLSMDSYADDERLQISVNPYGIPEPVSGNKVNVKYIDLILVPLLAFDEQGYRVGYGKGFYDRFMAKCRLGTRFMGLSLFEAIDLIDDTDLYDIKLHECITPNNIYKFR